MPTLALTDTLIKSAKGGRQSDCRSLMPVAKVLSCGHPYRREVVCLQVSVEARQQGGAADTRHLPRPVARQGAIDSREPSPTDRRWRRPARPEAGRVTKAKAQGKTFDDVAELYMEHYAKPNKA